LESLRKSMSYQILKMSDNNNNLEFLHRVARGWGVGTAVGTVAEGRWVPGYLQPDSGFSTERPQERQDGAERWEGLSG
jgi:hypothetical protein